MSLVGARIGAYEVSAKLGEGGMGEVFRARDTRLGRDVALKVLPPPVASDTDRLARFEREARALAALNHPGIGSIYGFEDGVTDRGTSVLAIVMELVPGHTLAERVMRGPIPVAEAVDIARQIADALDAAHEQGIVHRDLKPANIKLRPDGKVKVLDFGLARAVEPAPAQSNSSMMTAPNMTEAGVILGTIAYMSPEQARGLVVDKRSDIWSFGCVLFEMLTGRAAFGESTASDSIAAILGRDPDWSTLPPDTSRGVVALLQRCLEKDARRRLRDLGDVDLALAQSEAPGNANVGVAATEPRQPRRWLPWVIAGAATLVAAAVLAIPRSTGVVERMPPMRFELDPGLDLSRSGQFSVSPDSRHLVFAGVGSDGVLRLWIRSFDSLETRPLRGTEDEVVQEIPPMFWSPDSRYIGFFAAGKVKRVARSGGAAEIVCEVPGAAVGGAWNRDDVILVGNTSGGLLKCPAAGGAPSPVTATQEDGAVHLLPSFLPDGRHFIYLRVSRQNAAENGLFIGDLATAPDRQPADRLLATGFGASFVTADAGSGRLLFVRDGALMAQRFDPAALVPREEAVTVVPSVGSYLDTAFFTSSRDVLLYRGPAPDYQLTWFDRRGNMVSKVADPGEYVSLDLSRDGTRVVVGRENRLNRADRDLWLIDVERNRTTRLTSSAALEGAPSFAPDGTAVWFAEGARDGRIKRKAINAGDADERTLDTAGYAFSVNSPLATLSATRDGRFLVFTVESRKGTKNDIWVWPLTGGSPHPVIEEPFDQTDASVSPDGRWIAYVSNQSGTTEVVVRRFTGDGGRAAASGAPVAVSRGGGLAPRWRGDGGELFYQSREGRVMAVPISGDAFGEPAELFHVPGALGSWDVSRDGQRLLLAVPTRAQTQTFTVVLNWQSSIQ